MADSGSSSKVALKRKILVMGSRSVGEYRDDCRFCVGGGVWLAERGDGIVHVGTQIPIGAQMSPITLQ